MRLSTRTIGRRRTFSSGSGGLIHERYPDCPSSGAAEKNALRAILKRVLLNCLPGWNQEMICLSHLPLMNSQFVILHRPFLNRVRQIGEIL